MATNIGAGFNPSTQEPIDSRIIAANAAARLAIPWYKSYKGLLVFQQDTKELYVCIDPGAEGISNPAWEIVNSAGTPGGSVFPFTGSAAISGSFEVHGPTIIGTPPENLDTTKDLQVSHSLFSPIVSASYVHSNIDLFASVITSSQVAITATPNLISSDDLFIVKRLQDGEEQNAFIIDVNGVTILGEFDITPSAKVGGMFYSSSNEFFLGFE
jgi:hypothetical protein